MARVSKGSVYRRPESQNWFIKFIVDGVAHRESTGSPNRRAALVRLRNRMRGGGHRRADRGLLSQAPRA